ncbi:hypothetical protein [Campylobacter rectus]|nr:hypothetical protein [Campylobacter rectus]
MTVVGEATLSEGKNKRIVRSRISEVKFKEILWYFCRYISHKNSPVR